MNILKSYPIHTVRYTIISAISVLMHYGGTACGSVVSYVEGSNYPYFRGDSSYSFSLPQFNPKLGLLTGVEIILDGGGSISYEWGTVEPGNDIRLVTQVNMKLIVPGFTTIEIAPTGLLELFNVTGLTHSEGGIVIQDTGRLYIPANINDLSVFIGQNNILYPLTTTVNMQYHFSLPDASARMLDDTMATLKVNYEFTPVPEPSTYLAGISALGMLGLFGWKNRK